MGTSVTIKEKIKEKQLKLSFLNRALISVIVTASVLAGSLIVALPARAAGTETMSISPATQQVGSPPSTVSVSIVADTDAATRGWQANVDFDATKLQETGYTYGSTFYTSQYYTQMLDNQVPTVDNTNGVISGFGQACIGGSGGPTGTGTLVTITFNVTGGNNSATSITLAAGSGLADINAQPLNPTLSNGSITIGTIPAPDYSIINAATAAVSSSDLKDYNVTFNVKNVGTVNGTATIATVTPAGGTATTVNIPALNAGITSAQFSAGPFTLSGSSTTVAIQVVAITGEVNTSNNTATVSYQPPSNQASGSTNISGSVTTASISLTAPSAILLGNFKAGWNTGNSTASGSVTVTPGTSGLTNWTVTAQSASAYMTSGSTSLSDYLLIGTSNSGPWFIANGGTGTVEGTSYSGALTYTGSYSDGQSPLVRKPIHNVK